MSGHKYVYLDVPCVHLCVYLYIQAVWVGLMLSGFWASLYPKKTEKYIHYNTSAIDFYPVKEDGDEHPGVCSQQYYFRLS